MRDELIAGEDLPPLIDLFFDSGTVFHEGAQCLARVVNGRCVGGFAWTGWSGDTVQMHYVGAHRRWMTRKILQAAFSFCFQQLGTKCILAFLPADRLHAKHVAKKLGFKEFGPGPIPVVGIHMLTMVREDCRWLDLPSRGGNG